MCRVDVVMSITDGDIVMQGGVLDLLQGKRLLGCYCKETADKPGDNSYSFFHKTKVLSRKSVSSIFCHVKPFLLYEQSPRNSSQKIVSAYVKSTPCQLLQ